MKFAKIVFWGAGAWGVLELVPVYFMFDRVGSQYPPALTHPEFFYGFLSVAMAWQFGFFVIATHPARFRLMMLPAMLEKFGYVLTLVVLYLQSRLHAGQLIFGATDLVLGLLFALAFFKTAGSDAMSLRT